LEVIFSLVPFGSSFLFSLALVSSDTTAGADIQTVGSEVHYATKPFRLPCSA
jgi:hypothetical protein